MRASKWGLLMSMMATGLVVGCGQAQDLNSKFMTVNQANHSVTFRLIAGYNRVNDYDNYDGYANGRMTITVPVGYKVTIDFQNASGLPADIGLYDSQRQLAFQGAGDSLQSISLNPQPGIIPGASEKITFVASHAGTYRLANYENRFPELRNMYQDVGMWDVFQVVSGGTPSITTS